MAEQTKRLESLDVLRGVVLFTLTALTPFIHELNKAIAQPWFEPINRQFNHIGNAYGLQILDYVMPLFLFMSGVTIPFAMSKYFKEGGPGKKKAYGRLLKRFLLLWVFGMIYAGHLLDLKIESIRIYNNVLQAIAIGYVVASLLYLNTNRKVQIGVLVGLLILHSGLMMISVDGYGGGVYLDNKSFADYVGLKVKAATGLKFNQDWLIAAINYPSSLILGMFAGKIAKDPGEDLKKIRHLALAGLALVAVSLALSPIVPIFKCSWSSTFVLYTCGVGFILMALFYYCIDYKGWKKGITWLKVFGMNSIVAYMIVKLPFSKIADSVVYGLRQYVGDAWYDVILCFGAIALRYWILKILYNRKIFLRL